MSSESPPYEAEKGKGGKKRIRNFTADERAAHRVIEKQRRDALNESFLDLARLIPALAPCRRLSKSLIVHESVEYLQSQREAWIAAAVEIQALLAENLQVVTEINTWRELHGLEPKQTLPASDTLQTLMKVDQDVLGTFPGGFGDNPVEETKNGETRPLNNHEEPVHQAAVTETMQVDLSTRLPGQMQEAERLGTVPALTSYPSYSQDTGMMVNHLDNTSYMSNELMGPPDLDMLLPYDETLGISPILDENLQPFPGFSLHSGNPYASNSIPLYGNGFYMPPAVPTYLDARRPSHTQHS